MIQTYTSGESSPVFFIVISNAPKHGIIKTENGDVLDTLWTLFERQYLWKEAINQISVLIQIMSYFGASDRPMKKIGELSVQVWQLDIDYFIDKYF